ncbi:hypothetical protein QCA50_003199 [Cerrena zonata]|uniref:Pali-domain-containing protein n=1 Tax=Cerrena zonata TaxID=2478898 RepID=A0AAW0GK71_9APHY
MNGLWTRRLVPTSIATPVLLFISFLFLFLSSLSSPIIDTLDFFRIHTRLTGATPLSGIPPSQTRRATIYFGLSGFCLVPENPASNTLSPFQLPIERACIDAGVGYSFSTSVNLGPFSTPNAQRLRSILAHSLSESLVLNPIACAFIFVAFVVSLFAVRRVGYESRLWASHATTWTTVLAALLTTAAFIIDAVVAGHVKSSLESSPTFSVDWGNGVWIVLVATILMWIATSVSIFSLIRGRRTRKAAQY